MFETLPFSGLIRSIKKDTPAEVSGPVYWHRRFYCFTLKGRRRSCFLPAGGYRILFVTHTGWSSIRESSTKTHLPADKQVSKTELFLTWLCNVIKKNWKTIFHFYRNEYFWRTPSFHFTNSRIIVDGSGISRTGSHNVSACLFLLRETCFNNIYID